MKQKLKPIFDSFQEYIEAEDMIFETLQDRVTNATKDIK
tara:strand:+ start:302 stop:418 length:117 start_codon:yes stop_codon:yes gene_type:complete